jgi:hypothetical protein
VRGMIKEAIETMVRDGNYDDLFILQVVGNTPGAQSLLKEARARYEAETAAQKKSWKEFVDWTLNNTWK